MGLVPVGGLPRLRKLPSAHPSQQAYSRLERNLAPSERVRGGYIRTGVGLNEIPVDLGRHVRVSALDEPAFHKLMEMLLYGPMAAHPSSKYNLIDVTQEEMSSHLDKLVDT